MLGNEGVIVIDVQLGALASPARSLCNGQRHNEMPNQRNKVLLMNPNKGHYNAVNTVHSPLDTVLNGLQDQCGRFVYIGLIAGRGET